MGPVVERLCRGRLLWRSRHFDRLRLIVVPEEI